jgi:hypothetical protein
MFLDVPVICLSENIGVNKSYINEFTGLLVKDAFFEEALLAMRSCYKNYKPRDWALMNISPQVTTGKLSSVLDSRFGSECNSNLEIKVNSPEVEYFDKELDSLLISSKLLGRLDDNDEAGFLSAVDKMPFPKLARLSS